MIKHTDSESNSTPAERVRVTPEELAAAIAALEASKHGASDTIAIGDAVDELSLDNNADDILREVEAHRERRTRNRQRKRRGLLGLAAALVAVGTAGIAFRSHTSPHPAPPPPQDGPFTMTAPPNIFVEDTSVIGAPVIPFSNVPDDHAVRCSLGNLGFYSFVQDQGSWILIKHAGKIYMRGFSIIGEEAANGQPNLMTIYNSNAWYPYASALTLPLDQLKRLPDRTTDVQILATDVHLDQHAYEKW